MTVLGGYAAVAVTAITVQDTLGVHAVLPIPPDIVRAQGVAVLDDMGTDAVKIGMLGSPEVVGVAAELIARAGDAPAVIDPVLTAKGGAVLADDATLRAIVERLLPLAAVLTPNAPEAAAMTRLPVETTDDLRRAADALVRSGAKAVLVKGGHLPGPQVVDVLMTSRGQTLFESARIDSRHTHGTGCTLASAIATGLARGRPLEEAIEIARAYVLGAIRNAPGFGAGHGPMDHGWLLR